MLRPCQNGMIASRYSSMTSGDTAKLVLGLLFRISRSSREWQHSSGYVGVAAGAGPLSPTINSSSPMYTLLLSMRCSKALALRSTGEVVVSDA
ncbi:MAG: hypothetical protein BWY85_01398 [Firmicutes bacterium ADurb.Bin506]|nr:MAG: hypothetical protein BWY85_01398 [Firmicutes bacterium ADurb.Bin506]